MKNVSCDFKCNKKVTDLLLNYNIINSNYCIKIIENKIEFINVQLDYLKKKRPLSFNRKKVLEHNNKIDELENKKFQLYMEIEKEINYICKVKS